MSNIKKAFEGGKAFIPFITCGDPSLEITEQLVYAMEEAGADLIELGIPFSDPTAEGPVIQEANVRALSGGITTDKIFDMVRKIRQRSNIPLVFMTYANVVFSYGTERFTKNASEIGIDRLILPDVPYEAIIIIGMAHVVMKQEKKKKHSPTLKKAPPAKSLTHTAIDRKSTRLNSSHFLLSRMPSSA